MTSIPPMMTRRIIFSGARTSPATMLTETHPS